ncbi:DNA-binding protein, partial [Campylobacter jejuni]|nr:DNA-binding protein [Campylobacter jejuni]
MDNIVICKASDLEDIFKKILKENELIKNKT